MIRQAKSTIPGLPKGSGGNQVEIIFMSDEVRNFYKMSARNSEYRQNLKDTQKANQERDNPLLLSISWVEGCSRCQPHGYRGKDDSRS